MRKITEEAVHAFENGYNFSKANTSVVINETLQNKIMLYRLHGNLIAKKYLGNLSITLAGWNTTTTRERLNGLQGVSITTKQGQAYLNGEKWNGEWITIKRN